MISAGYKYEESRAQDLYMVLKNNGIDVYFQGQKKGDCISPYAVVKSNGSTDHMEYSTNVANYSVLCYVPENEYSKLEVFTNRVKDIIKTIKPLFRPTGYESPSLFDDTVNGYVVSVDYLNYRKK